MRHNLNVMHIEKSVSKNIIGTILNVDGKSKDNLKSIFDLAYMDIHRELHPRYLPNGRTRVPPASYLVTKKEKDVFCQVLNDVKVLDAYSSNASIGVNQKEQKLHSLKSPFYHILLHSALIIVKTSDYCHFRTL